MYREMEYTLEHFYNSVFNWMNCFFNFHKLEENQTSVNFGFTQHRLQLISVNTTQEMPLNQRSFRSLHAPCLQSRKECSRLMLHSFAVAECKLAEHSGFLLLSSLLPPFSSCPPHPLSSCSIASVLTYLQFQRWEFGPWTASPRICQSWRRKILRAGIFGIRSHLVLWRFRVGVHFPNFRVFFLLKLVTSCLHCLSQAKLRCRCERWRLWWLRSWVKLRECAAGPTSPLSFSPWLEFVTACGQGTSLARINGAGGCEGMC